MPNAVWASNAPTVFPFEMIQTKKGPVTAVKIVPASISFVLPTESDHHPVSNEGI